MEPGRYNGRFGRPGEQNALVSTVLVVEDERDLREVLRRYLERAGHAVLTTGSGLEGLRLLGDGGVDLVVLDLGLPDLDGLEILREARTEAAYPGGRADRPQRGGGPDPRT